MSDPVITKQLVDPALKLAEGLQTYGPWCVAAILFIANFWQFLFFMKRLKRQDAECRDCRNNLDKLSDARDDKYGKLLEQRHEQHVKILEEAMTAMHAMSEADNRTQAVLSMLEKFIRAVYNDIKQELVRLRNGREKSNDTEKGG